VRAPTLTWRALTTDDAPALARAHALVEAVDQTGEYFSEEEIRHELKDESVELNRDTLAALTSDGEVIAFVRLLSSAVVEDLDHVSADGAVVPDARGSGLGRRLVEWAEERAAGLHRERHGDVPGAVSVVVHENNPNKEALVRAAGYKAARWEYRMTRPLDNPLPRVPPVPPGLTLKAYTADLDEAVRHAHREAFTGQWGFSPPDEQRWSRWYTGIPAFRPDVSWLVLEGDEVAAFLLTYFFEADAAATGVREAFIGQLGVRPTWRRRGVGGLLLATALQWYRTAGYMRSALTVDTANPTGALGLYERAGFAVLDTWVTWIRPLE
jgi:mycothiol synthase